MTSLIDGYRPLDNATAALEWNERSVRFNSSPLSLFGEWWTSARDEGGGVQYGLGFSRTHSLTRSVIKRQVLKKLNS